MSMIPNYSEVVRMDNEPIISSLSLKTGESLTFGTLQGLITITKQDNRRFKVERPKDVDMGRGDRPVKVPTGIRLTAGLSPLAYDPRS